MFNSRRLIDVSVEIANQRARVGSEEIKIKATAGDIKLRVISMWMLFGAMRLDEITGVGGDVLIEKRSSRTEPWGIKKEGWGQTGIGKGVWE